jgi:hypothetical protein
MKPIEEFTEQDGILINNEQESQEIRELLHGMGLKWCTGTSYLKYKPSYLPVVIYPKQGGKSREPWAKKNNLTLHPASDYIIKAGDEVEVRDSNLGEWEGKFFYLCKTSKGRFVIEDNDGHATSWNQIRKAPNTKSKAIAEIKKIAEENGIEVKIL